MLTGQMSGSGGTAESIIYSESVRVESKVFYIDLKENQRGQFLKLTEKGANRPRCTVVVPAAGLQWFVKLLQYYIQDGSSGHPANKELAIENKIFHFSLGENSKGRFLRVAESGLGHTNGRNSLVIPAGGLDASGWVMLRDSLVRICALLHQPPVEGDVGGPSTVVGPGPAEPSLTISQAGVPVLSVGPKTFFFDLKENEKGKYLRITEVVRQERSSLVVPTVALPVFQQALATCMERL